MALTLLTDPGNFRSFKILIAAEYNGVEVTVPPFKLGDNLKDDFLAKSPVGKVPCLVTPKGSISESNAIARYISRLRLDTELYGVSFFDSATIDSWIDFASQDIELAATLWYYPVLGYIPFNAAISAKAKVDLAKALNVLEAHLDDKTYLVGHKISLADITVVSSLVYPFKFVADAAYRSAFPNVMRWFTTCVNQPQFSAIIGTVVLAKEEMKAGGAPIVAGGAAVKKEKAPQAPKEKKEKAPAPPKPPAAPKEKKPKEDDDEEDEAPKEKKEDHPFKLMDAAKKSPFIMDTWKKTYSNASSYDEAMAYFFENFDAEGWSLWRGDYMYNDELKILFMTSNLIAGFIQRTEEIRKWLFGTMTIRGVEGEGMKVTCFYLIRGDSIEPLIKCNDDAGCYEWTQVKFPFSAEDKAKVAEYWCSETTLEGEPLLDSRCYK